MGTNSLDLHPQIEYFCKYPILNELSDLHMLD